ncbi:glycosyl hydrolase [Draconibacterium sediminis]|uniref:Beta-mannosidase-like galactose-binding domain-containing protein n=1 Tax=Draconibacterium sediminis TaxID=1544798 RepID=A0A0D8JAF4_9BACT|nr:glycosyl hydrolase [Draconibacterium sediminis]KJF43511.1 hypothetical protein LH29_14965 [Draconibacterium sediminis]
MPLPTKTITLALLFFLSLSGLLAQNTSLEQGFKNPPNEAKARTWWHWINGNVSREGITADLEAMKAVGIQEAQLFNVNLGNPKGPASYLSDEWLDLFEFAALEAQRLNMELTFHNGPGWSSSGGPWITPEYAMQVLVFSEITLAGGQLFNDFLPQPETRLNYYKDIAILAFPKPGNDQLIEDIDVKNLSGRVRNHLAPDAKIIPESAVVHKADIVDLTSKVSPDGKLVWDAPDGDWILLRIGHTPTGKLNVFGSEGGNGLECDKMSKKAVDVFWKGGISPIFEKLDTLVGTVLKNCLIDSYEVGMTNWTDGFDREFKRLRGYDCSLYLPALAGYYVESGEISERFLWDFRRTIGDLIAENYYGYFRNKCHANNLQFFVEPYWGPFDNMQVGATGDVVMCEFWSGELAFFDSPKFVSSIAKLNGSAIVGAEAFTDMGGWLRHPANFKAIGDMAWAQGINRFVFHSFVHQPWDVAPGLTLGPFGIEFNRLNTWWTQGKAFLDYLARGQYLLQQGRTVADLLVFTGESSPNDALLMPELKAHGYDYDLIGANKLASLTVKDGLIYTPFGDVYKALILPATEWMTVDFLKSLATLARNGATIIGSKPKKSPSLHNFPECDAKVQQLAYELWDKGKIRTGLVLEFLKNEELHPDFTVVNGNSKKISFIHRKTEDADIYFVANAQKESWVNECRFRVAGKQPEIWDAETGEITLAPVWKDNGDGTTSVLLQLESEGSVFVVFSQPVISPDHIVNAYIKIEKLEARILPDLEIVKAEYGTFLPDGLVDVTEAVANSVQNNRLQVRASRELCSCDPAPGYKKELRLEYQFGDVVLAKNAMETEFMVVEPGGEEELKIRKAVFGKFERGVPGIPAGNPVYDVTAHIREKVSSGQLDIPVDDRLVNERSVSGKKSLHVVYSTNGEPHSVKVDEGGTLSFAQAIPKSKLITGNGKVYWVTPYAGKLTATTSSGKTEATQVRYVPEPIELIGSWEVSFSSKTANDTKENFEQLISWSTFQDDDIRYFSGTASYHKHFTVPAGLLKTDHSLQLDLGDVKVIAEVILNGKNLGVLWKSPFRININDAVQEGTNTLEVRITNLWPNRLIGDEQLPLNYKRKGPNVAEWPEWLLQRTERPGARVTFAAFKHWNKDSDLLSSGLLGPVRIIISKEVGIY